VAESPRAKLRSPTHAEVYDLVVQGLSNEEIAERLGLTPRTVKYRISGILETTGHTNRVGLIAAHGQAHTGKKKVDGLRHALAGERQAAVYDLLVTGTSGPQIAKKLGITPRTVKFHMSSILERTGMSSHSKLVAAHWHMSGVPVAAPSRAGELFDKIGTALGSMLREAVDERERIDSEIAAVETALAALEA
jgi:DNA-binding NarL/FixJ family response regulator